MLSARARRLLVVKGSGWRKLILTGGARALRGMCGSSGSGSGWRRLSFEAEAGAGALRGIYRSLGSEEGRVLIWRRERGTSI